jgi:hypothetical protein
MVGDGASRLWLKGHSTFTDVATNGIRTITGDRVTHELGIPGIVR